MKGIDMYSISIENENIVIRLNSGLVDRDALDKLLDYIEVESIRKRSGLTEAQASMLSKEVDRSVWESVKQKYMEK